MKWFGAIGCQPGPFHQVPAAVRQWMTMHLKRHISICKTLGHEPDEALIGPIVLMLMQLQSEDSPDDT